MSSNGTPMVMRLLAEQRKRCLATILTGTENSPWWKDLTEHQQQVFRDQIRSAIAVFYDLARDVIKVSEDDGVRNELALDLIRSLHTQQQKIAEHLETGRGR